VITAAVKWYISHQGRGSDGSHIKSMAVLDVTPCCLVNVYHSHRKFPSSIFPIVKPSRCTIFKFIEYHHTIQINQPTRCNIKLNKNQIDAPLF
jgi:hypothetical protein